MTRVVHTVVFIVAAGMFAVVVERDLRTRQIPNEMALAIAALGLFRLLLDDSGVGTTLTLAAAAAVFAGAFFLFWRSILGGGDVKLMAAMALLIGYRDLLRFLTIMSLCGALLGLVVFVRSRPGLKVARIFRPEILPSVMVPKPPDLPANLSSVPYGVAIVAAGAMILIFQTSFPR